MTATTADPALALLKVDKRFPGVHALKGVSIEVRMRQRGEISPIVLLAQRLAALATAKPNEGQAT